MSPVSSNWKVLLPLPDSIVIPLPSAAASLIAPEPRTIFLSSTVTVVELIVVVVPSICRLPLIITNPVSSPTAAGSIVRVAGPEIVLVLIPIAAPDVPVLNSVAVTIPSEILLSRLIVRVLPEPTEVMLAPPATVRVSVKRSISTAEPESPETGDRDPWSD